MRLIGEIRSKGSAGRERPSRHASSTACGFAIHVLPNGSADLASTNGWLAASDSAPGRTLALDPGRRVAVFYYALMFLVVALIAGVLGISGVAGMASQIAWVLFAIGIILLIVNFLTGSRPRSVV